MAVDGGKKAIMAALFANVGLGLTKFIGWGLTGASSMLAEAIHSVADSGNQVLLLVGARQAKRPADNAHPFGYARHRYYFAFLVAVVLFTLGGLFALYEAWHKFQDPHPIEAWHWVPPAVLVTGIVLESFSLRTAIVESNKVRGKLSWAQFVKKSRSPELPVILLEDLGALLGLVFALMGVSLTLVTGNGMWDAVGTTAIGVLLVVIAIILARETTSMLLGEAVTKEDLAAIEQAFAASALTDVIHMRTMHLGPEDVLVAAKVGVRPEATLANVAADINDAEERIRTAVPYARLIYIEPDLRRALTDSSQADSTRASAPPPDPKDN